MGRDGKYALRDRGRERDTKGTLYLQAGRPESGRLQRGAREQATFDNRLRSSPE